MNTTQIISILLIFLVAAVISFGSTPVVIALAKKIGAVDVPRDSRRMHTKPIPRLGGLAIFFGFLFSVLLFGQLNPELKSILLGCVIIVITGMVDDVVPLKWWIKMAFQVLAALVVAFNGVTIDMLTNINIFSSTPFMNLGALSIPITVIWIVGIVNAVNFIDGLDGLAVGVSSIALFSLLIISILVGVPEVTLLTAALSGACIGFLPFNFNPAKIFMGDTGSMLLGFMLAIISVQGLFKFYTIISFAVPFLILGLPIFDTAFAILRRLAHGKSPMQPDRGHLHHRLVDMGFSQKQSVAILYAISGILGLSAVLLTGSGVTRALLLIVAALILVLLAPKMLWTKSHGGQSAEKPPEESPDMPAGEEPAPQPEAPSEDALKDHEKEE